VPGHEGAKDEDADEDDPEGGVRVGVGTDRADMLEGVTLQRLTAKLPGGWERARPGTVGSEYKDERFLQRELLTLAVLSDPAWRIQSPLGSPDLATTVRQPDARRSISPRTHQDSPRKGRK
jgi:hypothetical protein